MSSKETEDQVDCGASLCSVAVSEPLEPGLYVGMELSAATGNEYGPYVFKVSGEAPWLRIEKMSPTMDVNPKLATKMVRIDQLVGRNAPE